MRPFLFGLFVYFLTVLLHLGIWRIRRPTREYATLLTLCAGMLLGATAASYAAQVWTPGAVPFAPAALFEYGCFTVLYGAIALSHISVYSAIQADSPSLSIVLAIADSEPEGLPRTELVPRFPDGLLVIPRLSDLVAEGLVSQHGHRFIVGVKGSLIARLYIHYRAMLKMERGG